MHWRWLSGLQFEHAIHYIVLQDCIAAVEVALADWSLPRWCVRCRRCAAWRWGGDGRGRTRRHHPFRQPAPIDGLSRLGAVRTFQRGHPTPGRHHQGRERCRVADADRGAWSYRFPARISRDQLLRQEALAKPVRDTAWKAQERLCRRYRKLASAGKPATVVTDAIARELSGFVWGIAKQATP